MEEIRVNGKNVLLSQERDYDKFFDFSSILPSLAPSKIYWLQSVIDEDTAVDYLPLTLTPAKNA